MAFAQAEDAPVKRRRRWPLPEEGMRWTPGPWRSQRESDQTGGLGRGAAAGEIGERRGISPPHTPKASVGFVQGARVGTQRERTWRRRARIASTLTWSTTGAMSSLLPLTREARLRRASGINRVSDDVGQAQVG